ncbi:MAG: ComF family protein [Lachnospiraceae bacterium]|nr:ComF family protein [Lachnospiraceae bacterium]
MINYEKLKTTAQKAGETGMKLLYPQRCPFCDCILTGRQKDRKQVCEKCREKLPWVTEPACMKCGKPVESPEKEFCEDCSRTKHLFDRGRAAFTYTGLVRGSVYRMKFQNRRDYLDFYAEAIVCVGGKYLRIWRPEVIVPIPMHWRKRAARGYNQSELLAGKISRITGIPCERKLLRCGRFTGSQKELGRRERTKNLRGSFFVSPEKKAGLINSGRENRKLPSSVLLVDDVYTTGSTMDEAARALREAGVRQIFFFVLCTGKGKKSLHEPKSVLY